VIEPGGKRKDLLVRKVNLIWYPVTLVPILALFFAAAYVPLLGLLALFLCFFWLSSLGFALYARLRKPKEPRQ
jgi:hypothetical protein